MRLLILLTVLSLVLSEHLSAGKNVKRSYVCPPQFLRQGHRCYYFSKESTIWQDAMFQCRNRRSNLAVIKQRNQDKLIRNFLNKNPYAATERWIGAVYDWQQKSWKWVSGKNLTYDGFQMTDKENQSNLKFHCVVMDPALQYRWSSRPCVEKKHFICQTKMKVATKKDKKKLERQYNVNKFNKLNEIPVPVIPDYKNSTTSINKHDPANYSLNDQALSGYLGREQSKRVKKHKIKSSRRNMHKHKNGTIAEHHNTNRRRKNKGNDHNLIEKLQWTTYNKNLKKTNPFYPRPIVMEFSFGKP